VFLVSVLKGEYIITAQLSRVTLEQLIVAQLFKKFSAFCRLYSKKPTLGDCLKRGESS
jgi:hypothetical protein